MIRYLKRACFYLLCPLFWGPAAADSTAQLSGFLSDVAPICQVEPGAVCVDLAWQFVDGDGDGQVSLAEAEDLHATVQSWASGAEGELPPRTRTGVLLGLFLVNSAGLDALFAGFDVDQDGILTQEEFLADVQLDERPLGDTLLDEDAVDRPAVAARFGALAPLLQKVYPPSN
ncbi:MAG: hypothetical protein AAF530_03950 [Pseudomonadota bacterium]